MEWILIFDSKTHRGVATDRDPAPGEYAKTLPASQCAWFRSEPSRYEWTGATIQEFPGWAAEQAKKYVYDKLSADLAQIDNEVLTAQQQPFLFNGHNYYPDTEFILGMFSSLPLRPDNYTKEWKTADKLEDGITNIYVVLDKTGITMLAATYAEFREQLWDAGETRKRSLKAKYLEKI